MSFVCAVLYFRMEYWDAYPAIESDLSFAQTTHSNIPVHLDWRGSCRLKDAAPMQIETNQSKALVKASSMTVPKPPPDKMANQAALEKNTLSERSQLYGSWLQGLREIASDLPSAHKTFKSIVNENARLPELLKFVMAELEHKLALDEFKTESSERGFWISVKAMANSYGIDFSDFEKVCCSSKFKSLNCPLDGGIPGLVDQGHEAHWNFSQNSYHVTHPSGDISISELPSYPPPEYPSMASVGVFQPFPLDAARDDTYTTPSPASFGQSPFPDYQSTILPTFGINSPEQGHRYTPRPLYTSLCTRKTILDSSLIRKTSTIVSTASGTPLKHKSNQCLSVCLKTKEAGPRFPTIVPEACRRKIQRQRRRAMSYNHLATSFGASQCSLTWNASSTEDSDLQFLLEKELKRSDVGSLGRIILPKRQAEEKLPYLEAKEGVTLAFEDLQTSQIWNLRFRFWPNNKTRMYLLESTGSFVRSHHLQEGDYIVLYKNPATGNYMINGKKSALPKVLGMSEQRSLPSSSEICGSGGESSLEPAFDPPTKAPEKESANQLETMMDAKDSTSLTETDLVASGSCYMEYMEDSDDVIKGFSTFEADGRSIDEIFDFKE